MTELACLNLLHYPLKLESIINKVDYYPFCSNKPFQTDIIYHKSLLLYLICNGYPFENIFLDQRADPRSHPLTSSICRECEGEFRIMKLSNNKIFKPIAELYHTYHFLENNPKVCFKINQKCIEHIYHVAQQTLYNISKEILYKHFLLYHTNIIEFDVVSYMINISLDLLI